MSADGLAPVALSRPGYFVTCPGIWDGNWQTLVPCKLSSRGNNGHAPVEQSVLLTGSTRRAISRAVTCLSITNGTPLSRK